MKRRAFVRVAAGGFAAATFSSGTLACGDGAEPRGDSGDNETLPNPGYEISSTDDFLRWSWVHGGGDRTRAEWETEYGRLAQAGFHGVLVSGGETEVHAGAAHAAGLEFHRWVWTLNRNGDEWVKANHPEWFTVSRKGDSSLTTSPYVDYYKWLCPTRPEVRSYLRDTMAAVAREPGVDGVHLDYVRHCDVILPRGLWAKYDLIQDRELPEFDFCYCDVCRETFAALHGIDPMELQDPSADEDWRRFRWDGVTGLVRELADAVHEVSPAGGGLPETGPSRLRSGEGKPISAAVFPTPSIARRLVRQAWDEWPLDAVFPMLYHSFYEEELDWIGRGVREGLAALTQQTSDPDGGSPSDASGRRTAPSFRRKLFAGLYLPALSEEERLQAASIAREAGAHGVSFFEMSGLKI